MLSNNHHFRRAFAFCVLSMLHDGVDVSSRRDSYPVQTKYYLSLIVLLSLVIFLQEWMMRNGGKSKDPTSSFAQSFANTADIEVQHRLQL